MAEPSISRRRCAPARPGARSNVGDLSVDGLGFIRLSLNPAIVDVRKSPGEVLDVLSRLTADEHHTPTLTFCRRIAEVDATIRGLLGHQQVTDAYLVAVAEANDATLLTLDRRLVANASARDRVEALVP
jgi:predicted nucleic acid-binding protein